MPCVRTQQGMVAASVKQERKQSADAINTIGASAHLRARPIKPLKRLVLRREEVAHRRGAARKVVDVHHTATRVALRRRLSRFVAATRAWERAAACQAGAGGGGMQSVSQSGTGF